MSLWPSKLVLSFRRNRKAIPNLLVFVVLQATEKNNFTIGPLVTDKKGQIRLTVEELRRHVRIQEHSSPMDYTSSLEDCRGFQVLVETGDQLRERVARVKEFYPADALDLQNKLVAASNDGLMLRKEIWLPIEKHELEFEL